MGKRGQPTKYKPEYCKKLIEHQSKGYSYESFAHKVGVAVRTISDWEEKNPEFLQAKNIAYAHGLYWWERLGIEGVQGHIEGFNATIWIFMMKCRFGYRDPADQAKMQIAIQNKIDNSNSDTYEKFLEKVKHGQSGSKQIEEAPAHIQPVRLDRSSDRELLVSSSVSSEQSADQT